MKKEFVVINQVVILAVTVFLLNGCFNSETIKCSDDNAVDMVKERYSNMLNESNGNASTAAFLKKLPQRMTAIT